jgi:hypothetical protein
MKMNMSKKIKSMRLGCDNLEFLLEDCIKQMKYLKSERKIINDLLIGYNVGSNYWMATIYYSKEGINEK